MQPNVPAWTRTRSSVPRRCGICCFLAFPIAWENEVAQGLQDEVSRQRQCRVPSGKKNRAVSAASSQSVEPSAHLSDTLCALTVACVFFLCVRCTPDTPLHFFINPPKKHVPRTKPAHPPSGATPKLSHSMHRHRHIIVQTRTHACFAFECHQQ